MTTLKEIRDILNNCTDEQLQEPAIMLGIDSPGHPLTMEQLQDDLLPDNDFLEYRETLEESGVDTTNLIPVHKKGDIVFYPAATKNQHANP